MRWGMLAAALLMCQMAWAQEGVLVPQWRPHGIPSHLAFSPDGSRLAALTSEGGLVVFDAASGLALGRISGLPQNPVMVAWAQGNSLLTLAWEGNSSQLTRHDPLTGRKILEATLNVPVVTASITPDGAKILVVERGSSNEAVWYTTATLSRGAVVRPPEDFSISAGGVSADGNVVALGAKEGLVALMKPDGKVEKVFACSPDAEIVRLAFSPDGKQMACADSGNTVRVYSLGKTPTLAQTVVTDGAVISLVFPPDGPGLFVGGEKTGGYYDAQGNIQVAYTDPGNEYQPPAQGIAVAKDGRVAVGLANDDIFLLSDKSGSSRKELGATTWTGLRGRIAESGIVAFFLNPLGGSSGALDLASGGARPKLQLPDEYFPEAFILAPDGTYVVTGDHLQEFRRFDLAKGTPVDEVYGGSSIMALSPDGKLALWADETDDSMHLAQVPAVKEAVVVPDLGIATYGLFSGDSKTLWLAYEDGKVVGLDVKTLAVGTTIQAGAGVNMLALYRDAQHLVLADRTDTVCLAELQGGAVRSLFKMNAAVTYVIVSPDGNLVLAMDGAGGVVLWDMAGKKEVWRIDLDGVYVEDVGFSPNGKRALIATDDGQVRYLDVRTGVTVAVAKFFEEGGWFVGTSAGFFDCSKGMEQHYAIQKEGALLPLKDVAETYRDAKKVKLVLQGM